MIRITPRCLCIHCRRVHAVLDLQNPDLSQRGVDHAKGGNGAGFSSE